MLAEFWGTKSTLMQIKTQPALNFLCVRFETTVATMMEKAAPYVPQLLQEILDQKLRLCGPVYWNYFGFEGDESKPFDLEVAIPVNAVTGDYHGRFSYRRSEPFRCVEAVHEGTWASIPETYGKLFAFIGQNRLIPTGENRECYINADFEFPEANQTIIRIGIQ